MLPAVGQGALGLEVRVADGELRDRIAFMDDPVTRQAVTAERAFLARLEGGCVVPVAARGRVEGDSLALEALISDLAGQRVIREQIAGSVADAAFLGDTLAGRMLDQGGREILAELYGPPI